MVPFPPFWWANPTVLRFSLPPSGQVRIEGTQADLKHLPGPSGSGTARAYLGTPWCKPVGPSSDQLNQTHAASQLVGVNSTVDFGEKSCYLLWKKNIALIRPAPSPF